MIAHQAEQAVRIVCIKYEDIIALYPEYLRAVSVSADGLVVGEIKGDKEIPYRSCQAHLRQLSVKM